MKNLATLLVVIVSCLCVPFSGLAATFTVTTNLDSGPGTLRQAILDANANAGADVIEFNMTPAGAKTITPATALPTITDPTTINGATQLGFVDRAIVELNGTTPAGADGLRITTSNSVIRFLVINRWKSDGIEISGGQSNVVEGCIIGLDVAGVADQGNTVNGVFITNSVGNLIGGSSAAARNIVSGNNGAGVRVDGVGAIGNQISGNIIGLNFAGTAAVANSANGININLASNTRVGGTTAADRNVVSGNTGAGVLINGAGATGNVIVGNYIGSDLAGTVDLGNSTDGVQINGVGTNTVGGAAAGEGNLILGNNAFGVQITGTAANGNVVRGNTITLSAQDGAYVLNGTNNAIRANSIFNNTAQGIDLDPNGVTANDVGDGDTGSNQKQNFPLLTAATANAANTVVAGTLSSGTNIVYDLDFFSNTAVDATGGEGQQYLGTATVTTDGSGNVTFGATLSGVATGKYITATATDPFGNTSEFSLAVNAQSTAPGQTFQVTTTADTGAGSLRQAILDANAVAASNSIVFAIPGGGVQIISPVTALPGISNTVTIDGYTQSGAVANTDANGFNGVLKIVLSGTNAPANSDLLSVQWPGVTIRGLNIVGSKAEGIEITAAALGNCVVEGCLIGIGLDNSDQGNAGSGVSIVNAVNNRVGGTTPAARNVLSGNNQAGVLVDQAGARGNMIFGNLIGVTMDGLGRVSNTVDGIRINLGSANLIGSTAGGSRNLISGNNGEGIEINGASASNNVVAGNIIGADITGLAPLTNTSHGIQIIGNAPRNIVGGLGASLANIIAFNNGDGVYINGGAGNMVRGNSIHDNVGLGIDLDPNGVSANDAGDTDVGSNLHQNFPALTSGTANAANTVINGTLNSAANTEFTIDFYSNRASDPTGNGEGEQHLGSATVTTDGSGNAAINVTLPTVATGKYITATATDPGGNTSEFAANVGALTTAVGQTFSVINTNDTGAGSLRQALLDANAAFGSNRVVFAIPGDGPHFISPATALPAISNTMTIDGYTQPLASANSSARAFNGVIKIVLSGTNTPNNTDGLNVQWSGVTVRGVNIIGFKGTGDGIELGPLSANCVVEGCVIGMGLDNSSRPNANHGVYINNSAGHRIGGTSPAQRNVLSGNTQAGVYLDQAGAQNNVVLGNNIGISLDGLTKVGNADGVRFNNAANNIMGGTAVGARNVISGNTDTGIELSGASTTNNLVQGNYIGPDVTGSAGLNNTMFGVWLTASAKMNVIGGLVAGAGNLIVFNGSDGVNINPGNAGTNNAIRANLIHSNVGQGIDLGNDGVLVNDIGDGDPGPNQNQNYPSITAATANAANTVVVGTLSSGTNITYGIDFFSNIAPDASGNGEGQQYLGSTTVTTDGNGIAVINATLPVAAVGKFICATATDPFGNTSEFGPCFAATSAVAGQTFLVTNTNDSGVGSLRQAILDANLLFTSGDTINFAIPGPGPHTNLVLSPLPGITDRLTINGYSQSGTAANTSANAFNGTIKIILNGVSAGTTADGLSIQWPGVTVRGLQIVGFRSDGIEVGTAGTDFVIEGCLLGWTWDNARFGNGANGIQVNGGAGGRIGDALATGRNVISGNTNHGVLLTGATCATNLIAGNFVGVGLQGMEDAGNNQDGINVSAGAHHNTIGGGAAGARNTISGNGGDGVEITGAATFKNLVLGNYIGATLTTNQINGGNGVNVSTSSHDNRIGGLAAGEGNRISGNGQDGVQVTGSTNNAIRANSIVANGNHGIDLGPNGTTANDVGDVDVGANNLQNFPVLTQATANPASTQIKGTLNSKTTTVFNLDFYSSLTTESDNVFEGDKYLGSGQVTTDASGNGSFDVTVSGVVNGRFITATATDPDGNTSEFSAPARAESTIPAPTLLVTTTADNGAGSLRQALIDAGNYVVAGPVNINFQIPGAGPQVIAPGNSFPTPTEAVAINGFSQTGASANTLAVGNNSVIKIVLMGTNFFGPGLRMTNSGNVIQGLAITQFSQDGILLLGNSNRVEGCFVGVGVAGDAKGNSSHGVHVLGGAANQIGGTAPAQRNVISANQGYGVYMDGGSSNIVQGNYIGTDPIGTLERRNISAGVYVGNSPGNLIGGAAAGARNVISGHASANGIMINDVGSGGSRVLGNFIGTDVTGTNALPNSTGVFINNSPRNVIGGVAAGEGNVIALNNFHGVSIIGFSADTNNVVRGNSMFSNGGLGINIQFDGVQENDLGDADEGANHYQNFPVLTAANAGASGIAISGTLNSVSNRTYTVDFYANVAPDDSGNGEGEQYLGAGAVTTDASGNGSFMVSLSAVIRGRFISATATDPDGNTSEFSDVLEATTTFPIETYTVINTNNAGAGSLREALLKNNASVAGGNNLILFNIPGAGPHLLAPASPLPALTHAVTINGFTQPNSASNSMAIGNNAVLKIEISGVTIGGGSGLVLQAPGIIVRGLAITRFSTGIEMRSSNDIVAGCWIGLAPNDTAAANGFYGVGVFSGPNNIIGGATPADRNIISANQTYGIYTVNNSSGAVISGNYIGVNAAGVDVRGNGQVAIYMSGTNHVIGGSVAGAGNVISGNGQGITFVSVGDCRVSGNFIGLNAFGLGAVPNGLGSAINIQQARGLVIGGSLAAERNVIGGHQTSAILLSFDSSSNRVSGNYIGTDITGTVPIPNAGDGISITSSDNNQIGGATEAEGNVIAFNGRTGVFVNGGVATNNMIRKNRIFSNSDIGIDLNGGGVTPNDGSLDSDLGPNLLQNFPVITSATLGVSDVTIAGALDSAASQRYELEFFASVAADASGNGEGQQYLGTTVVNTDAAGHAAFSATFQKVAIGRYITATATDANNNTSEFSATVRAGSTRPPQTLVVTSRNDNGPGTLREALTLSGQYLSSSPNKIQFNIPGAGAQIISLLTILPSPTEAVEIDGFTQSGASANTLTTSDNAARLIQLNGSQLPGFTDDGLRFQNSGNIVRGLILSQFPLNGISLLSSSNNLIEGCLVISNRVNGINVVGSLGNMIGGTLPRARNLILGNLSSGINISGSNADILGNFIGVDQSGVSGLANLNGVFVNGDGKVTVGGVAPGEKNWISFNNRGVVVQNGVNTRIRGNRITANVNLGIDLGAFGVTANDTGDADIGGNNLQNFPAVLTANITPTGFRITGTLNSGTNLTYTLDFYWNAACDGLNGEGQDYIGSAPVTTDGSGNASFDVSFATQLPRGVVTATATDAAGNTSEFSACRTIGTEVPPQTYTVLNTSDSGAGSLRQAITDANTAFTTGPNIVRFNISGSGVRIINPLTPLPTILSPMKIDGFTQPGAQVDTAANGVNAVLLIRLDGTNLPPASDGLLVQANGSTVRGLILTRFSGAAIHVKNAANVTVTENFVGTDHYSAPTAPAPAGPKSKGKKDSDIAQAPPPPQPLGNAVGVFAEQTTDLVFFPLTPESFGLLAFGNQVGVQTINDVNTVLGNSIISGNGSDPDTAEPGGGIFSSGSQGLTIQDSIFSNNQPDNFTGVRGTGSAPGGLLIINNKIGPDSPGIIGRGVYLDGIAFAAVRGNLITGLAREGIWAESSPIGTGGKFIQGNTISNNRTGILVDDMPGLIIGGSLVLEENVLSGNTAGAIVDNAFGILCPGNQFPLIGAHIVSQTSGLGVPSINSFPQGPNDLVQAFIQGSSGQGFTFTFGKLNPLTGLSEPFITQTSTAGPSGIATSEVTLPAQPGMAVYTVMVNNSFATSEMAVDGPDAPGNATVTQASVGSADIIKDTEHEFEITVRYQPTGQEFLAVVEVTDVLPQGFEYLGYTVTGGDKDDVVVSQNQQTLKLEVLFIDQVLEKKIRIKVRPVILEPYSNEAVGVVTEGSDSASTDNSSTVTGSVIPAIPGVENSLQIDLSSASVNQSQRCLFKVTVRNSGATRSTLTRVLVNYSSDTTIFSAYQDFTRGVNQTTFNIGNLEAGASFDLYFDLFSTTAGTKNFQVTILQNEIDANSANNTTSGSFTVTTSGFSDPFDFGDAPDTYGTTLAVNGARHSLATPGPVLGPLVDGEANGAPSPQALGDDLAGTDDEDGVIFRSPLVAGLLATVDVTVSSVPAYLDMWIDYNGDGDFNDGMNPGEPWEYVAGIIEGHPFPASKLASYPLQAGVNHIRFFTPNTNYRAVPTFARFRVSKTGGLSPFGPALDGEVEDYYVQMFDLSPDFGDAPDSETSPRYPTLLVHNGAIHLNSQAGFQLGQRLDFEADGHPSLDALGDDQDNGLEFPQSDDPDDEDGVTFPSPLVPGQTVPINVFATINIPGPAKLDAWIDFNQDSDWNDPGEKVLNSVNLIAGNNVLQIAIPADALTGQTYARFRMSSNGNLNPTGVASSGEVEDYMVAITRPKLLFTYQNRQLILSWTGDFQLQRVSPINGQFVTLAGASPQTIDPVGAPTFFRLIAVPPGGPVK